MAKQLIAGARRGNIFYVPPESVVIVGLDTDDGPEHYLYDERINLPLDASMVANIRALGVIEPCAVEVIQGTPMVVDGRRRIMHARAANEALKAEGEPLIQVPLVAVKGDEERMASISISLNEVRRADDVIVKAAKAQRMVGRGMSVADVALAFAVEPGTIRSWLKTDSLAAPVKKAIAKGEISTAAATKLADLPKADQVAALTLATEASPGKRPTAAKVARIATGVEKVSKVDAAYERGVRDAIEKIRWSMATSSNPTWLEGTRCALEMVQALIGEGPVPAALSTGEAHADARAADAAIDGTPRAEAAE